MNFSRTAIFHIKTAVFLKYSVRVCLRKQFFASTSPKVSLNLICLTILVTLRSLTQLKPKIRVTNLQ